MAPTPRFVRRRRGVVTHTKDADREHVAFASRSVWVFVILAALFSLLAGRLVWLMVFKHDEYQTLSNENRIHTVPVAPARGIIYDRHGEVLAGNRTVYSVVVVPDHARDLEATLAEVVELIDLDSGDVAAFHARLAASRRPSQPTVLKRNIDARERAVVEVNRHRLEGVDVHPETVRHYPHGAMMAHAVGSVRRISAEDAAELDGRRYRATRFVGKRGVEAYYESSLHGEPGVRYVERDAAGVEHRELADVKPVPGQNITLHLDSGLQIAASAALGERRGAVVAIEPRSGGILAFVSSPGYDPNQFVLGIEPEQYQALVASRDTPLLDRAARGRYAPGSTFKPVVAMAGLALGLTDWERTIVDRGEFRLPGRRRVYRDWNWRPGNAGGQGVVDLNRAIYRSSNVYFYELGSRMATDALPHFAAQLGYGRVTSLDVADADPGVLPDSVWKAGYRGEIWYPGDTINMAIGQGDLLATPLQLATVAATFANNGQLVPPRMVKASDGELTELVRGEAEAVAGPVPEDWERMAAAMADVVHRGNKGYGQNGTAWAYIGQDIEYRMAGKSGTAQVVEIPQGQEYDEEALDEYQRKHAWFIAFAPLPIPEIAVAVLVENGGGGSSVAGPVARAVFDRYLLGRPPATPAAVAAAASPRSRRASESRTAIAASDEASAASASELGGAPG